MTVKFALIYLLMHVDWQ